MAEIMDDKTARGCESILRFLPVYGLVSRFLWYSRKTPDVFLQFLFLLPFGVSSYAGIAPNSFCISTV